MVGRGASRVAWINRLDRSRLWYQVWTCAPSWSSSAASAAHPASAARSAFDCSTGAHDRKGQRGCPIIARNPASTACWPAVCERPARSQRTPDVGSFVGTCQNTLGEYRVISHLHEGDGVPCGMGRGDAANRLKWRDIARFGRQTLSIRCHLSRNVSTTLIQPGSVFRLVHGTFEFGKMIGTEG